MASYWLQRENIVLPALFCVFYRSGFGCLPTKPAGSGTFALSFKPFTRARGHTA